MRVDPERVLADLDELAELTSDDGGAQRLTWSEPWQRARRWLVSKLEGLPVKIVEDEATNLWVTLPGRTPRAVAMGSHMDSVPGGGPLDGVLGVVAGLEVLRSYAAGGSRPPVTLKLVDFSEEEGDQSGLSLFGSSAVSGTIELDLLDTNVSYDGRPSLELVTSAGIDLDALQLAQAQLDDVAAFAELHIEQSTRLESAGAPLGAVTGTAGVERHGLTFFGRRDHAARPMEERADALLSAAQFLLRLEEEARRHQAGTLCGHLEIRPNVPLIVADQCDLTFDIRSFDAQELAHMNASWPRIASMVSDDRNTAWHSEPRWRIPPMRFDPRLVAATERAIEVATGRPAPTLGSPQLHDAGEMARAGVPTVMLFVQSVGGVSHSKDEYTEPAHLRLAVTAFADVISEAIELVASSTGMTRPLTTKGG
jgi:beta-ureidopropionase / N-carbamoyl-L-amino-acid hydrolase